MSNLLSSKVLAETLKQGTPPASVSRLKAQLARRLVYEEAFSYCAGLFISDQIVDTAMPAALGHLLRGTEQSRVYLMENFEDKAGDLCMRMRYEVCQPKIASVIDDARYQSLSYTRHSEEFRRRLSNNTHYHGAVLEAPEADRTIFSDRGALSFLLLPIQVQGQWWGALGLENSARSDTWQADDIRLLRTVAAMIGAFIGRKRAEEALAKSEQQLRLLAENTLDGIWQMDMELRFTYVNPAVTHTFGYTTDEWIGSNLRDHVRAEELDKIGLLLAEALDQPDTHPGVLFETRMRHKNGELVPVEILARFLRDGDENIIGLQGTTRDIRERKRADAERRKLEGQIRQLYKMEALGTLAGGVAHDFNNILSAIIGYTELALLDTAEGGRMARNLIGVLQASERAADLVKQILTFSRQSEQMRNPIQISSLVKEALKLLRSSTPTTIEIRSQIPSVHTPILADPTQIHQIVMNLCTNAAHAMEKEGGLLEVVLDEVSCAETATGGAVTPTGVTADGPALNGSPTGSQPAATTQADGVRRPKRLPASLSAGNYLHLQVSDTGHGISTDIIDSIFDPYFTTKAVGEGTGMGLSVVLGIVKTCGGEITVQSSPEAGTTFDIYLPQVQGEVADEAAETAFLATGSEHILFVDDEPTLVIVGKQLLERLGYSVDTFTDSREALVAFEEDPRRYDLVMTDMTMPDLTGDKLAKAILKIRPDMPIVLCTGFSRMINEERARSLGIRAYLMKPLTLPEIAKSVRAALDAP
ncbi:MAG: PAS domain S-box protein [Desulfosarcinaceae bacterium]|nr:PAS domain S-box protein [Desulfosarcinaceae bacterium]